MSRHRGPVIAPQQKSPKRPRTVAEALSSIERTYATMATLSRKDKRLLRTLRRTCRRISEMFNLPLESILLDELVEIDKSLITYIEGIGIDHQTAVQYVCDKEKLLEIAHRQLGWSCDAYELRKAWQPVRAALRGQSDGSGSIIRFAIKHGMTPGPFNQETIDAWKENRLVRGRSLLTVNIEECHFRKVMRNAKLQCKFRNWRLGSKNPPKYRQRLSDRESGEPIPDLPDTLRKEILEVIRWKTSDEDLEDRDAALSIRPVSGRKLLRHWLELYSFATIILGLRDILHLHQLLTEEIVCGFIDWLQVQNAKGKPRCNPKSILTKLDQIHHLTRVYPILKGGDYRWLTARLNAIAKEAHFQVQARKLTGAPDYETVASISSKLLTLAENSTKASELERAFLYQEGLIFLIGATNAYRSRNLREAKFHTAKDLNFFETEITTELLSHLKMPRWANELRNKDPKATFVVYHALEADMKAGQELWQLLPEPAASIFKKYVRIYRPIILRRLQSHATTLFLARNGNALSERSLLDLVKRVYVRYAEQRGMAGRSGMTVKLFRDLVGAHMLASGSTLEEVADRLAQLDPYRTTARFYVGGYNTSHAVSALEDEINQLVA